MKEEITKYNGIVKASVPPSGVALDTFDLGGFWRAHEADLPAFSFVLRAVLTNSPNSVPPERVFSILNDSFGDLQDNSLADYIELSLQLQFNTLGRNCQA